VQLLEPDARVRQAGRDFTALADVAVTAIAAQVEAEFARAHGRISGGELAILALGRYGGQQLSVGSDLDLVFLFDGDLGLESDGRRPLGTTSYFNRLAQRLVTALTAPTAAGSLYEVDTRLRPSGEQGLLAVTLGTFEGYQRDDAWTWEHMALTRCRIVRAGAGFSARIGTVVSAILCQPRDPAKLRTDALAMRADLRQHFPGEDPLDLKFTPGGMIDAEFILQYLQLRTASAHPEVIGETLSASANALADAGALTLAQADRWCAAYRTLSQAQMLLRLTLPDARAPEDLPAGVQTAIARAFSVRHFADVLARIDAARVEVRRLWDAVFQSPTQ